MIISGRSLHFLRLGDHFQYVLGPGLLVRSEPCSTSPGPASQPQVTCHPLWDGFLDSPFLWLEACHPPPTAPLPWPRGAQAEGGGQGRGGSAALDSCPLPKATGPLQVAPPNRGMVRPSPHPRPPSSPFLTIPAGVAHLSSVGTLCCAGGQPLYRSSDHAALRRLSSPSLPKGGLRERRQS